MKPPTAVQVHVFIAIVIIGLGLWTLLSFVAYVMDTLVKAVGFGA